jgi:hypothetical protein
LLVAFTVFAAGPVAPAGAQSDAPAKCFKAGPNGEPPTCSQDASGKWVVSYPDGPAASNGGEIIGVLVVIGLLSGGGFLAWKVWMARRMAAEAGMPSGRATAMTLLTDDGLEATYVASALRGNRDAGDRLRELDKLRDEGLLTAAEYDARRRAIVESV